MTTDTSSDKPVLALVLMLGAVACFPVMQAAVKTLSIDHGMSFIQTTWGRYFFHFLLVPLLFPGTLRRLRDAERVGIQLTRGVLLFVGTGCAFLSLRYLALPMVTALSFIAPILITVLAAVFLREAVGWRRWTAVGAGFIGVIFIVRPDAGFSWPMVLPLVMASVYAVYQVLTRVVGARADASVSLFFTALVGAVAATLFVPFVWIWPTPMGWVLMIGSALMGGLGHWLMILAYRQAQASFVAPFAYTELIWAAVLGYVVFDQGIGATAWTGAAIIVASGLYIAYRERVRARRRQVA
ncbi:MAG: DMT family transporter [Chromatiales bacterium]|jgi:drug/metabolite transporter (DMT)-like permease|nr:DMT family transporter [Chromatiales bacterium]